MINPNVGSGHNRSKLPRFVTALGAAAAGLVGLAYVAHAKLDGGKGAAPKAITAKAPDFTTYLEQQYPDYGLITNPKNPNYQVFVGSTSASPSAPEVEYATATGGKDWVLISKPPVDIPVGNGKTIDLANAQTGVVGWAPELGPNGVQAYVSEDFVEVNGQQQVVGEMLLVDKNADGLTQVARADTAVGGPIQNDVFTVPGQAKMFWDQSIDGNLSYMQRDLSGNLNFEVSATIPDHLAPGAGQ